MKKDEIRKLLESVRDSKTDIDSALEKIAVSPYHEMDFAKIDNHREIRVGFPEVIYCEGKTVGQVTDIIRFMLTKDCNILATRAGKEMYESVRAICPQACYNEIGRVITIQKTVEPMTDTYIAIIAAGTSDLPVVEEAVETAKILGNRVERVVDVGVAGIHRLFSKLDVIRGARVVIVIAGMEGALASVVGGLVDKPVIAVPTSVGYGANFGGLSALLAMLNSCASGVSVVNIDNGFGAAYTASMINKL